MPITLHNKATTINSRITITSPNTTLTMVRSNTMDTNKTTAMNTMNKSNNSLTNHERPLFNNLKLTSKIT